MKRGLLNSISIASALIVVAWIAWVVLFPPPPVVVGATSLSVPSRPVSIESAVQQGASDAPVVVVVFSDFQCPYCARLAQGTIPQLQKRYVAAGKVRLVFRHLPLTTIHADAMRAAQAAACAGRAGKFWEMHDRLFDDRQRLGAADIAAKARRLSLDDGFERCLTEETAREEVERDMAEARALSIAATPTVLVGRPDDSGSVRVTHRFGAIPFSQLAAAIDDLLSGAAAHKTGA